MVALCTFPCHQLRKSLLTLLLGSASMMGETQPLSGDTFKLIV